MIEFKALIHKETGTVIKYEDWYKSTRDYLRIEEKKFNPRDVLFSDDFEIIYDSEFTTEELKAIYCNADATIDKYPHAKCESEKQLKEKVLNILTVREITKNKYKNNGK